jgi:hypothetical protein
VSFAPAISEQVLSSPSQRSHVQAGKPSVHVAEAVTVPPTTNSPVIRGGSVIFGAARALVADAPPTSVAIDALTSILAASRRTVHQLAREPTWLAREPSRAGAVIRAASGLLRAPGG